MELTNQQLKWVEREYLALNTIILGGLLYTKSKPVFYVPYFINVFICQYICVFHKRVD